MLVDIKLLIETVTHKFYICLSWDLDLVITNPVGMFAMGKKKIVKYESNNNNHTMSNVLQRKIRGTQREYSSKPLKHTLLNVFSYLNGRYWHIFIP